MADKTVYGVIELDIDGKTYLAGQGKITIKAMPVKRTQVPGTPYITEEPADEASFDGTVVRHPGFDPSVLWNATSVTCNVHDKGTGKTHQLRDAAYTGEGDFSTGEPTFPLKLSSHPDNYKLI